MRLSRPCYDKYWRCPGWAGGGLYLAKRYRCDDGTLRDKYDHGRFWRWQFRRCDTCDVLVLPYWFRRIDPTWIAFSVKRRIDDWRWERAHRFEVESETTE